MKSIKEVQNLKNKKVLTRVDFNVPIGDGGIIDKKNDWRIKAALPTIQYLLKKEAKIILISHFGRPETKLEIASPRLVSLGRRIWNLEYSLKSVAKRLEELLDYKIKFVSDCIGNKAKSAVEKMQVGEIILFENLRFYNEEEKNDKDFAKKLANVADIYINDAFSVSHRAHASVSAITKFLPSYAGLLLEKEIRILSGAIDNPERPATIIIGGAKAKTKLLVIKNLLNKFDHIIVGGIVANVILKAKGIDIGKSMLDGIDPEEVKKINLTDKKLHIPIDAIGCNTVKKKIELSAVGDIGDYKILDIGPESRELYLNIIKKSKTIIWNGPMGKFENDNFADGTKAVSEAVTNLKSYKIIGGGDTIAALNKFGCLEKVDYICTGGGAMLKFLSGEKLPGIRALK